MTEVQRIPEQQVVRIAAVQYLLRSIHHWSGLEDQVRFVVADVDFRKLVDNRISGTTIPLHDKRADVYQN